MEPQPKLNFIALEGVKLKPNYSVVEAGVFSLCVALIITGIVTVLSQSLWVALATLIIGLGTVIYLVKKTTNKNEKTIHQMQQFASQNQLNYLPTGSVSGQESGSIFKQGGYKTVKDVISGNFRNLPFKTFYYQYTVGTGRYRRDYDLQVMELALPRVLPHMIIDSLVEPGNQSLSTLPIVFDNSQKIELEGDFHKYFALYAPDSYGVSALTILAPDAMEALMKHAALCDIEIIDNKLYFYWPVPASTRQGFEQIFSTVDGVLSQIQKKLETSDIFAHTSQAQVHTSAAKPGVRLKKNKWAGIFTIILIVGYSSLRISAETLPPQVTAILGLSLLGAMIVSAVYMRIKNMKKKKLRAELKNRSYN